MANKEKPRYDHIDPAKLKTPTDRAIYDALVAYVDKEEDQKKEPSSK